MSGGRPRVLYLDIENTPYTVHTWDNNPRTPISHENIVKRAQMICAAWKWEGHSKIYRKIINRKGDDRELAKELQRVISKADAVVAHFGDGHDLPWINKQCLIHGLGPLKNVIQIDTWKICKRRFKFYNNKLDFVAHELGFGNKLDTDFDLWKRVMRGNRKARAKMLKYNAHDVRLLEKVYLAIRAFEPAKLNRALFVGDHLLACRTCPACGEPRLRKTGYGSTRASVKILLRCLDCNYEAYRIGDSRPR